MTQKVVILYNKISERQTTDELDVLDQVRDVNNALVQLGYETSIMDSSFNIDETIKNLRTQNPDFVFNLVEGINDDGQLITVAPAILDYLHIPYTGCNRESMFFTSNKVLAKQMMKLNNVPTAEWITADKADDNTFLENERYIVKAIWEDASIGLDEDAVVSPASKQNLIADILNKDEKYKINFFAERYIHGRDFTIDLLDGKQMPVCEVTFLDYYSDNKVRVFNYNAKWIKDTPEYDNTNIDFDFEGVSNETIKEMQDISDKCWKIFNLNGYARIDFRVDESGKPFVLEINPNPCITRNIMFDKILQRGQVDYIDAIKIIVNNLNNINWEKIRV